MNIKEQIAVMQAFVDGKEIQCREFACEDWRTIVNPVWNWLDYEYRIKPPKHKKIKFEAWIDRLGELHYMKPYSVTDVNWVRVPSEDKEVLL